MRLASSSMSGFAVRDGSSAVISSACAWWPIIPCMNLTSAPVKRGSSACAAAAAPAPTTRLACAGGAGLDDRRSSAAGGAARRGHASNQHQESDPGEQEGQPVYFIVAGLTRRQPIIWPAGSEVGHVRRSVQPGAESEADQRVRRRHREVVGAPRRVELEQRVRRRNHDGEDQPRRPEPVRDDDAAHRPASAAEPGDDAGDRLAIHVADAPDADLLPAEERAEHLGGRVGGDIRAPDQREYRRELVLAGRPSASCAPIGTITNLKAAHSVEISRQLARASTPSMTRDCGP